MSGSLRDQLLKAGLVTEDQVRKAERKVGRKKHADRKKPKAKRGEKRQPTAAETARRAKVARDKELEAERAASRARNARNAQMAQIAEGARLNDANAELVHNFVKGTRVKRVHVTPAQRDALAVDRLAITVIHNRVHLVDAATAAKLRAIDPSVYLWIASEQAGADGEDDHPVPDDLTW